MKSILITMLFTLISAKAFSVTNLEKTYQSALESINQAIHHELIFGDLTNKSARQSLRAKIKNISPLAKQVGGRKHALMVTMGFNRTLNALIKMNKTYRPALDMVYPNGLTGRDIFLAAINPENNSRLVEIYQEKKDSLSGLYTGRELNKHALDLTLEEIEHHPDFAFLKMAPSENYVMKDSIFSFVTEKCLSNYGENDFFVLLLGFHRCYGKKYRVDRYTIGFGYYNGNSGHAYVTGLKIGKKSFNGVGVKAQVGIYFAGGIGVFLGNGLILSLDLEKGYGAYAGVTYLNLKHK